MEKDLVGIANSTRTWEQDKQAAELEKKEMKLLDMNIKLQFGNFTWKRWKNP